MCRRTPPVWTFVVVVAALGCASRLTAADVVVPPSVLPAEPVPAAAPPTPPTPTAVLADPVELPWFVSAELGAGTAGMYGQLVPPRFAHRPGLFPLPSARLGTVLDARVTLGYDLSIVPGRLGLTWQSYTAAGDALLLGYDPLAALFLPVMAGFRADHADQNLPELVMRPTPGGNATVRSRADVTLVDLTYSRVVFSQLMGGEASGPVVWLKVGGRVGTVFSDDRADGFGYSQSAANFFYGAGPVVGLRGEIARGAGPFVGVDGGVLFGRDRQRFREIDLFAGRPFRSAEVTRNRAVEFVTGELGWATKPNVDDRLRTAAGVRFTQFFGVGDIGPSHLDFQAFTVFFRVDVRF